MPTDRSAIQLDQIGGNVLWDMSGAAYAAEDVLGNFVTIGPMRTTRSAIGIDVIIIEPSSQQKAPIDIFFYDQEPPNQTDNAALVGGVWLATVLIGMVSFYASDYVNHGSGAVAQKVFPTAIRRQEIGINRIYAIAKVGAGGAPTYAGPAPKLIIKYGGYLD